VLREPLGLKAELPRMNAGAPTIVVIANRSPVQAVGAACFSRGSDASASRKSCASINRALVSA
jgi:hypothetical protein